MTRWQLGFYNLTLGSNLCTNLFYDNSWGWASAENCFPKPENCYYEKQNYDVGFLYLVMKILYLIIFTFPFIFILSFGVFCIAFPSSSAHHSPYPTKHCKKSQESLCIFWTTRERKRERERERELWTSIKPSTMPYQLPSALSLSLSLFLTATCAVAQTSTIENAEMIKRDKWRVFYVTN
jgi:hypothetical protein